MSYMIIANKTNFAVRQQGVVVVGCIVIEKRRFSAHDAFLELPSPGIHKNEKLQSQII